MFAADNMCMYITLGLRQTICSYIVLPLIWVNYLFVNDRLMWVALYTLMAPCLGNFVASIPPVVYQTKCWNLKQYAQSSEHPRQMQLHLIKDLNLTPPIASCHMPYKLTLYFVLYATDVPRPLTLLHSKHHIYAQKRCDTSVFLNESYGNMYKYSHPFLILLSHKCLHHHSQSVGHI